MSSVSADSTTSASKQSSKRVLRKRPVGSPTNIADQTGDLETSRARDDSPIADRLRKKRRCQCPKVRKDCLIILDNLRILRRKITLKDSVACGAVRFHLRSAQSFLKHIYEFLSNGQRTDECPCHFDLAMASHFLEAKKACFASKHKCWTLMRKNRRKKDLEPEEGKWKRKRKEGRKK